jgi:hypothetical protein
MGVSKVQYDAQLYKVVFLSITWYYTSLPFKSSLVAPGRTFVEIIVLVCTIQCRMGVADGSNISMVYLPTMFK